MFGVLIYIHSDCGALKAAQTFLRITFFLTGRYVGTNAPNFELKYFHFVKNTKSNSFLRTIKIFWEERIF